MKKLRIYIDTSVIGGCFDEEFALWSHSLLNDCKKGRFEPLVSTITAEEIAKAPENVRKIFSEVVKLNKIILEPNDEVLNLMEHYQKRKILDNKFKNDMLHVAIATVHQADIVVSWNFKHIVHFEKIRQFNAANLEMGYQSLSIHSPKEVTYYEKDF